VQPLLYSSRFVTGDREVDAQHRALFHMANELLFAHDVRDDPDLFLRGLAFLARYCQWHFATEERAMERAAYPGLERHRQHHGELTARIARLQATSRSEGPNEALRLALHRVLSDWLSFHIRILDQEFVQHVRGGTAGASVLDPAPGEAASKDDLSTVSEDLPEDGHESGWKARLRRLW